MSYTIKSEAFNRYSKQYYLKNDKNFDDLDKLFMIKFASISNEYGSKAIYYKAIYRFKRFYPKTIVKYLCYLDIYIYFRNNNASKKLKKNIRVFLKVIMHDAVKAYCKDHKTKRY